MVFYTITIHDLDHDKLKDGELKYLLKQPVQLLVKEDDSTGYWNFRVSWREIGIFAEVEKDKPDIFVRDAIYLMKERIIEFFEEARSSLNPTACQRTVIRLIEIK